MKLSSRQMVSIKNFLFLRVYNAPSMYAFALELNAIKCAPLKSGGGESSLTSQKRIIINY